MGRAKRARPAARASLTAEALPRRTARPRWTHLHERAVADAQGWDGGVCGAQHTLSSRGALGSGTGGCLQWRALLTPAMARGVLCWRAVLACCAGVLCWRATARGVLCWRAVLACCAGSCHGPRARKRARKGHERALQPTRYTFAAGVALGRGCLHAQGRTEKHASGATLLTPPHTSLITPHHTTPHRHTTLPWGRPGRSLRP
jgi:hypothetical protein